MRYACLAPLTVAAALSGAAWYTTGKIVENQYTAALSSKKVAPQAKIVLDLFSEKHYVPVYDLTTARKLTPGV